MDDRQAFSAAFGKSGMTPNAVATLSKAVEKNVAEAETAFEETNAD